VKGFFVHTMEKVDIKNFSLESLEDFLQGLGKEKYRAKQIFKWLYQRGAASFDDMTNLSKDFRRELALQARITTLEPEKIEISVDGNEKIYCSCWKTDQALNPFSFPKKIVPLSVFPPRWGVPWAVVSA